MTALFVHESARDMPRVAIPRPEAHLVARFGPSARGGLDVHAMGVRETVQRKTVRGGQRTVMARLELGAGEMLLGVRPAELAGRVVPLEDLWGAAETRRLLDRLASAADTGDAAAVLEGMIAERVAGRRSPRAKLALAAADMLATTSNVVDVALALGVSERHLRRLFRETVGMGPKAFARLRRFERAIAAAREDVAAGWAGVAAAAGYYDQAHLIAEFRAIAGVTPRALLGELEAAIPEERGRAAQRWNSRAASGW